MESVVGGGVWEHRVDGDEEGSDAHVAAIKGVVSVTQADEPDCHVDSHVETVVEVVGLLDSSLQSFHYS